MKKHALVLAAVSAIASGAAQELPAGVAARLATDQPQDLLVQFEEADLEAEAQAERARPDVAFDTPGMTIRKAQRFAARKSAALSALRTSVAVADINGDGILDAIVANYDSNTISVLLGNPNGTFQPQVSYAVGNKPYQIA